MGSFGAPTKNLGSRSLPQLRPSPSKAAAFRGSEAKRLKLEALRRANDDDKLARAKRAAAMARRVATPLRKSAHFPGEAAATVLDPGPCEPSQSSKPGSAYGQLAPASREARLINDVLGPGGSASRSRRSQTPKTPDVGPVDWRVLAACEVVLDREDEVRRTQAQKDKVVSMHKELQTQLERNAARRADVSGTGARGRASPRGSRSVRGSDRDAGARFDKCFDGPASTGRHHGRLCR